jgi:hypothetical protein
VNAAATAPPRPALERPVLFAAEGVESRGRTLEDAVLATWRELRLRGGAPCLVCGSTLDAAGACADCGAELS